MSLPLREVGYLGGRASIFQQFVSTAGLLSVINSILTGVFIGLLIFSLFNASLLLCITVGVVVFAASVALYMRYQHQYWAQNEKHMKVLFPSENDGHNLEEMQQVA